MTSISQKPGLQPQGQSNTNQAASQAHSASPSVSGKSSPLAPVPAPASSTGNRTYASATKKAADSTGAQHGKSPSISPVNGRPMQQSQSSGVTIVNGAPAQQPPQGDHSRKPSVTISSAGTTGYIPNGGSAPSRPNNIQFGALDQPGASSPNMGNPAALANQSPGNLGVAPSMNPRITSPQTSPSPIPQPASSGGRPPSTYQSQGNPMNFGSFGESGDANVSENLNTHEHRTDTRSFFFVLFFYLFFYQADGGFLNTSDRCVLHRKDLWDLVPSPVTCAANPPSRLIAT